MGARLGLRPWETERLQPVEVWELWKGWRWRTNRDLTVVATALHWLLAVQVGDKAPPPEDLVRSLPGYVPED